MDIEELAAMGRDQRMCPYFLSRESGQRADLVLMPYNYLFDPVVRRGLQVNWTNSIVIFDEAHNVEQVATDAASCEISTATLGSCITELKGILQALQEGSAANDSEDPLTSERVVRLFTIVNEFLNRLVAQPLIQGRSTLPGRFLYTCFNAIGITITSCSALQQEIEKCVDFIAEQLMSMGGAAEPKLGAFLRLCRCVFRGNTAEDCLAVSSNYKVFIEQAEPPQGHMHARVLHYWCFSPGVALNEVKSLGARCILLTSGTLSPLHSFAYELKQPFPIQLENPHVIQPNQVWVGTFKTSKAGTNLLSTYTNRELPAYKDALGSTLVEILRLVPGGALVFFASYTLLNSCIKRWEEIGLLARLEREMTIIKEPRGAQDMRRAAFDFEAALASNGRAALFAVLRGKASEGIDFRDEKARAVIVTGIPFAPAKDPRVELKRQFLDETKDAMKRATGGYVDGAQWYTQCATRAVNQSIGRVIRHKRDWGAVILLDQRFAEDRFVVALSKWVRPHVQHFTNFESGLNSLSTFFRNTQHCKELVQNPVPHELRRQQLERCAPVSLNTPDKGVMQGGIRLRTVTVDVSALGDDTSFVQPDLLASQPNDASAAALIDSMKRTLRAASNGAQSRGTSHTPCAESSAVAAHSGGASIAMLFQRTTQQRASVTNARTTTR
jgi:regulator of telomere elongation helicase 1